MIGGKPATGDATAASRRGEAWAALVFLTLWILGIVLLTALPMIGSFVLSFSDYDLLSAPRWIGTENYERLFTDDPRYLKSLEVTTVYVLVSVPLSVAVAPIIAVTLSEATRSANFFRGVYYLPSLLGGSVAIGVLWRQIFGSSGLVNMGLSALGFETTSWIRAMR